MVLMLRTPGLQRLVGRATALLTFVGRNTAKSYTTPVSYFRRGERVTLTCQVARQWWRNLNANPQVGLRLAGKDRSGTATIAGAQEARALFEEFLTGQRLLARGLGISFDNGVPNPDEVTTALQDTVIVAVTLDA